MIPLSKFYATSQQRQKKTVRLHAEPANTPSKRCLTLNINEANPVILAKTTPVSEPAGNGFHVLYFTHCGLGGVCIEIRLPTNYTIVYILACF